MNIFLVNKDNKHSRTLMEKLAIRAGDGAIIPLTDGEMKLYRSDDFQVLSLGCEDKDVQITKLEPDGRYIAVCKAGKVNMTDLINAKDVLSIPMGIVRVKG
jgi:uncharacterized protein YjlB